jgi:hypothetical protein
VELGLSCKSFQLDKGENLSTASKYVNRHSCHNAVMWILRYSENSYFALSPFILLFCSFSHASLTHLKQRKQDFGFSPVKKAQIVEYPWFTPVILVTWEAVIRRITVQGQPE